MKLKHVAYDRLLIKLCLDLFLYNFINRCRVHVFAWRYRQVVSCCGHSNEPSGSIKRRESLDSLMNYELLSSFWSLLHGFGRLIMMYTVTWWLCCRLQARLYRVCSSSLSTPGWEQSSCSVWHSWCTHVTAYALPPHQLWLRRLQKPLGTTCSGMDISQIRYSQVYLHIHTIES